MIQRLLGLLLCTPFLVSCSDTRAPLRIPFVPMFDGHQLVCGNSGDVVQLTDLRFYVADIQLLTRTGELIDMQLDVDSKWQQADLALLDFEDGQGHCDNGSSDLNRSLRGHAPALDYVGLQFTIGVPFERNHSDPLLAMAPLADAAMHWHWRAGYKFLRAGIRTADDGFWIHLGSTGCEGTVQDISGCGSPNRVRVVLDGFVPGKDVVAIELAAMVAYSELEDGVATDCSSGPAEASCFAPFEALGLTFGTQVAKTPQRVFQKRVQY